MTEEASVPASVKRRPIARQALSASRARVACAHWAMRIMLGLRCSKRAGNLRSVGRGQHAAEKSEIFAVEVCVGVGQNACGRVRVKMRLV